MIRCAVNQFDAQESGCTMTNTATSLNIYGQTLFLVYLNRVITIKMCERV